VLVFVALARTRQTLLSGAVKPTLDCPMALLMRLRHRAAQNVMGPIAVGHLQKHKHISNPTLSDLLVPPFVPRLYFLPEPMVYFERARINCVVFRVLIYTSHLDSEN